MALLWSQAISKKTTRILSSTYGFVLNIRQLRQTTLNSFAVAYFSASKRLDKKLKTPPKRRTFQK
jgi:hypothetical protein